MKKIFTRSFMFACVCFFASCSKDVKAPAKVAGSTASASAPTATQTTTTTSQNQGGHTCGGGSGNSSGYNNGH